MQPTGRDGGIDDRGKFSSPSRHEDSACSHTREVD